MVKDLHRPSIMGVGRDKILGVPDKNPLFTKILPDLGPIFCPVIDEFC